MKQENELGGGAVGGGVNKQVELLKGFPLRRRYVVGSVSVEDLQEEQRRGGSEQRCTWRSEGRAERASIGRAHDENW